MNSDEVKLQMLELEKDAKQLADDIELYSHNPSDDELGELVELADQIGDKLKEIRENKEDK